jgi:hypothetical protein
MNTLRWFKCKFVSKFYGYLHLGKKVLPVTMHQFFLFIYHEMLLWELNVKFLCLSEIFPLIHLACVMLCSASVVEMIERGEWN